MGVPRVARKNCPGHPHHPTMIIDERMDAMNRLTATHVIDQALEHLNRARQHLSEAQSWVTALDSPTTAEQNATIDVLRTGAADLKAQLDHLKGRCYEALGDDE